MLKRNSTEWLLRERRELLEDIEFQLEIIRAWQALKEKHPKFSKDYDQIIKTDQEILAEKRKNLKQLREGKYGGFIPKKNIPRVPNRAEKPGGTQRTI